MSDEVVVSGEEDIGTHIAETNEEVFV